MTDRFRVDGKVAVVTGAASGIGRASAVALANAGATVVCGDLDEAGLQETANQIGGATATLRTDVAKEADVAALVALAVDTHGRLDVMANVAGIIVNNRIVDTTEEELDKVLSVNLKGVFFGCKAALAAMTNGGSIINMASAAIDTPAPGLVSYAMSKAAVTMLTRTAAHEGGKAGVRVNAVAPGYVVTPMTKRGGEERAAAVAEQMKRISPIGAVGEPEDIADSVLFLASDASRYMTGQILRPNGGAAMPW
ncbi:MAG: SDR family oxidoreductase [Actinobacteria bacterium]|nr:SDR family oxidoreductase [Actinomycetota bacterium]